MTPLQFVLQFPNAQHVIHNIKCRLLIRGRWAQKYRRSLCTCSEPGCTMHNLIIFPPFTSDKGAITTLLCSDLNLLIATLPDHLGPWNWVILAASCHFLSCFSPGPWLDNEAIALLYVTSTTVLCLQR